MTRATKSLTLTLQLRSRASDTDALERALEGIIAGRRAPLSRREFAAEFGAAPSDVAAVRRFARSRGFRVSSVGMATRLLRLSGPKARLARAFGAKRVSLPSEIADCVLGVHGMGDDIDFRRHGGVEMAVGAAKTIASYLPPQVAALYKFPRHLDGRGQAIGVVALGGGYLRSDLRTFFRALRVRAPSIRAVSVDGVRNAPRGDSAQYDGEVTGDVETVAALAPKARIAVYFAPNTPRGFLEAVATAVHDRRQRNTVLSISWGLAEPHWDRATLHAMNQVLLEAAVLGITVCCSSGDYGYLADPHDRTAHVNFPASSPYVLACGGTTLLGRRSTIHSERVWHSDHGASGGGVSEIFPRPAWQHGVRVPRAANGLAGRGVPDVAANADPLTGYRFFGHGQWHVGAGTSASAPLWAGLMALINQSAGTAVGLPTPFLYARFKALVRARAVVPIIHGGNGLFRARRGWSCCTGVGSPRGARLAEAFARRRWSRALELQ